MSITLRVNKGSALTYDEMDRNLASFFFSSSLHNDGATLRLHYTGSNALDISGSDFGPRFEEISLTASGSGGGGGGTPAGVDGDVQFKSGTDFASTSTFNYNIGSGQLGIGTAGPVRKLHVNGDTSQAGILRLSSTSTTSVYKKSYVEFTEANTLRGYVGRSSDTNPDIYVNAQAGGRVRFNIGTLDKGGVNANGIGAGTISPTHPLTVVGTVAVGSNTTTTTQGLIAPNTGQITTAYLPAGSTTAGLVISSPVSAAGGHVVVGLNTDAQRDESFSVIRGSAGSYVENLFTVRADGNVGIGNRDPESTLTVEGNISGSGELDVEGVADYNVVRSYSRHSHWMVTM